MWNTALIFSNKIHDLQKKKLEKKFFYCRLCKNYWITYCTHMMSHEIWVDEIADVTQQTFILMKTSWRRLEDVFRLRLQKTSSSRWIYSLYSYVFRRRLQDVLQKRHQDILKTPSRRSQEVFNTSSRHLQDVLLRRFQDVFKTTSRHLQDLFIELICSC